MAKLPIASLALCGVLALSACSSQDTASAPNDRAAEDARQSATAGAPGAANPAVAAAEPDYPQPAIVMPPRPKPGAPHGPGFDMPVIDLGGYEPSRPMEVLRDAHMFTADHPDVASYVPCYCGCGSAGHRNNADCFVRGRDPEGYVTEWEPHGAACAVCIDIAVDSMRMRNSGASVTAIRKKVQGDYRERFPSSETPTPSPPSGK